MRQVLNDRSEDLECVATPASSTAFVPPLESRLNLKFLGYLGSKLSNKFFPFNPSVGKWQVELIALASALTTNDSDSLEEINQVVDRTVRLVGDKNSLTADQLKFSFATSLLFDIRHAGGQIHVQDSEIAIGWPDWNAKRGREAVRAALSAAAEAKRRNMSINYERLAPLFASELHSKEVDTLLCSGRVWLEEITQVHPSGVPYSEAFSTALQFWTMPYRGREGRGRRLVIVGEHPKITNAPVVMGLLEIADDGPYGTARDEFLSLTPATFHRWLSLQKDRNIIARKIAVRLNKIRNTLLPIPGIDTQAAYEDVLENEEFLRARSTGRSRSGDDLEIKKRCAYLLRLAYGEKAFSAFASGREVSANDVGFREGVRAMHNLVIPRIHMEVAVCGAIPPFSGGLGGKLITAFMAHPFVVETTRRSKHLVLRQSFDVDQLIKLLPNWGALALTTKGLYPRHSALYNRASVPGVTSPVRLLKIGDTRGNTTTLVSGRTVKLAEALMNQLGERRVSRVHGTGGAKRQRILESAARSTGLPHGLVHAGIQRPVYGIRFVENLERVVWTNQPPEWTIPTSKSPEEYSYLAVREWRERWGQQSRRRLSRGPEVLLGLLHQL